MKKVLVTGGNSYIGKHCIAQLIDKGYHVKTSVRSKEKAKQLNLDLTEYLKRDTKIEYTIADLLNDDGWDEITEIFFENGCLQIKTPPQQLINVPAKIISIHDIPRTRSGKITELAVRDIIHGKEIKNSEALSNPEALELYRNLTELKN